jgi:hypothetical protein
MSNPENEEQLKERAREIYVTIFEQAFLSNCGHPLTQEAMRKAIFDYFQIEKLDAQTAEYLDEWFAEADANNDGSLSKVEVKKFIYEGIKEKRFAGIFAM